MAKSILILGSVAAKNVDAFNRSGKHASAELENGHVVLPGDKSTTAGENDVYVCSTPATANLGSNFFHIVYEAPVVLENGKYRGLSDDPREFSIPKNTVFNMFKPQVGDEIIISADGLAGDKGSNVYVVPADGTTKLTWASSTAEKGLAFKLLGTTFISVGNARVTAYKFVCVAA